MKTKLSIILQPILLLALLAGGVGRAQDNSLYHDFERFFNQFVHGGRVDYQGVRDNSSETEMLQAKIRDIQLNQIPEGSERKAFWINVYNFLVIKAIADHYPVKSPLDIPGFFKAAKHPVGGLLLTLDQIENEKIRAIYQDPRIHFALVCAAQGCPKITPHAFRGESLDAQLERRTRATVNDPNFIRVFPEEQRVEISEIFNWFEEDFLGRHNSIIEFLNRYREQPIPKSWRVEFYNYDWRLNDRAAMN